MLSKRLLGTAAALAASASLATPAQAQDMMLGEIFAVGFNFCPRGSAPANGQLLSISSNTALFSLLGTMYGGNGTTNFALPDLRGRSAIGAGQGGGMSNHTVGEKGGSEGSSGASGGHGSGGGGNASGTRDPYLTVTYCIATQGIFPSRN